jgi:hypothetical protein
MARSHGFTCLQYRPCPFLASPTRQRHDPSQRPILYHPPVILTLSPWRTQSKQTRPSLSGVWAAAKGGLSSGIPVSATRMGGFQGPIGYTVSVRQPPEPGAPQTAVPALATSPVAGTTRQPSQLPPYGDTLRVPLYTCS